MADKHVYAEQAEEVAQRQAQRLAEEEELREHRRNLQFKVCIKSCWPSICLDELIAVKLLQQSNKITSRLWIQCKLTVCILFGDALDCQCRHAQYPPTGPLSCLRCQVRSSQKPKAQRFAPALETVDCFAGNC